MGRRRSPAPGCGCGSAHPRARFRFLGVDEEAWHSLKESVGSFSQIRDHLGYLLKSLSEESNATFSEALNKEVALTKVVDASAMGMNNAATNSKGGSMGRKLKPKMIHLKLWRAQLCCL
ncbi:uncharacterized protein LOC109802978 [Cajanus cajan]|uniref:uncharacterized protein LOC109802978 n=1 Tax=Cajanus cajan TaxID=3821 RepID=UPI0010FB6F4B|nr:uncharacterized protein LOC109802978 [Cajanus cajan]